jgi:hypothetical protein
VIPTREPFGLEVPGTSGNAPTVTVGGLPGTEREATTLWLASVPALHGLLNGIGANPAVRR